MKLFKFRESLVMSLRSIVSNKVRSFLTALGVMIGVAAVIALVALGNGAQVYKDLFEEGADPVGQKIRINGIGYRVAGIMEEKGSSTSDGQIFIPITSFQRYISGSDKFSLVNIQAASLDNMREVQIAIEDEILKLHKLPNMDAADFYIANQLDLLTTVQGVASTFTLLLGSIAAISLMVGGIGIMNIMLVSVTERTREIGVRMALGAKGGDILSQFLTEAIILSVGGGLLGIIIGLLASWAASRFGGMASVISINSIFLAFSFTVITGLFFGGYPAYRASKLDPIEALRYE